VDACAADLIVESISSRFIKRRNNWTIFIKNVLKIFTAAYETPFWKHDRLAIGL
jgi:hypothetical protein